MRSGVVVCPSGDMTTPLAFLSHSGGEQPRLPPNSDVDSGQRSAVSG